MPEHETCPPPEGNEHMFRTISEAMEFFGRFEKFRECGLATNRNGRLMLPGSPNGYKPDEYTIIVYTGEDGRAVLTPEGQGFVRKLDFV